MNSEDFLNHFGTRNGRWLANRLGLSGPGSTKLANLLSAYCWNNRAAVTLHDLHVFKGKAPGTHNHYSDYCARIMIEIKQHPLYHCINNRFTFC